MMGQPSAHTKLTPTADVNDEDKHQGLIITKDSTHYDDGNDSHVVDYRSWVNALNDDANTHINATGPYLVANTEHPQHLTRNPFRTTPRNRSM